MEQRYFTASHKNNNVLKKSSSGGVFTAVSDKWFSEYKNKAVIYGCVLNEKTEAKHIRVTSPEKRDDMCGSKYISSDTRGIYKLVYEDLKKGNYVLFSGTPCQISAVKSYLKAMNYNYSSDLLTVEVICHGVGSNSFFYDYLTYLEKKYKSKTKKCSFRSKTDPEKKESMQILFHNNRTYTSSSTKYDWFYSAYLKNYILRPSCFCCKFAKPERNSDICIGDNWKEYGHKKSEHLSSVIVSTDLGNDWFMRCSDYLGYTERSLEEIYQDNLYKPSIKPADYDKFVSLYSETGGFMKAQKFFGNSTFGGYIRSHIVDILYKLKLIKHLKRIKQKFKSIIG